MKRSRSSALCAHGVYLMAIAISFKERVARARRICQRDH